MRELLNSQASVTKRILETLLFKTIQFWKLLMRVKSFFLPGISKNYFLTMIFLNIQQIPNCYDKLILDVSEFVGSLDNII